MQLEADLRARDVKLTDLLTERENLLTGKLELDAELLRMRAKVTEARRHNEARPDTHDYSEAETRDAFIGLLLREAGWPLDMTEDRDYPVTGMPSRSGEGFVDYVLWGEDGKPLGLVEAKCTRRYAQAGQQQAKLYAGCLEAKFGQRPMIFYTNGYEHWIWNDGQYPPRQVSGFYTRTELALLIQRRNTRVALASVATDKSIAERYYQERAIRNIAKARGVAFGGQRGNLERMWPMAKKGNAASAAIRSAAAAKRNEDLLPVIAEICGTGRTSPRLIAESLNERGITAAHGGAWSSVQVRRVLENG